MESKFQLTFDYNNVYNNNNPVLPGDGDSQPAPGKTYRVDPIGIVSPSNNEFSWYCLMDIEAVQKLAKENSDYMQLDTKNYNRVMVKCEKHGRRLRGEGRHRRDGVRHQFPSGRT